MSFLWSAPKGGFGGKINVGKLSDLIAGIEQNKGFFYVPEARMWVTEYPAGRPAQGREGLRRRRSWSA